MAASFAKNTSEARPQSTIANGDVCLLCAQHPGQHGWGHFMRMLALKRAFEESSFEQTLDVGSTSGLTRQRQLASSPTEEAFSNGFSKPTSPPPQIILSTLALRQVRSPKVAGGVDGGEKISLLKEERLLSVQERRTVIEFPTPQAILKWTRAYNPRFIILDTRERGMGILSDLLQARTWLIVLDSRHPLAFAHAHILLTTLGEAPPLGVRNTGHSTLPLEFSHFERHPNLDRPWEQLLPVPLDEGKTAQDLWSSKYKVPVSRSSRFVLYIGGIDRPAYWKRAFQTMITLIYTEWLLQAKQPPFECLIFVEDRVSARRLWDEVFAKIKKDILNRFSAYIQSTDHDFKGKHAFQLRTQFPKRLSEAAFRGLLGQSEVVLTHPGLTVQAALPLGCVLFLLSPTPYLAKIARGEALEPFYTRGTQAFMRVMQSPRSRISSRSTSSNSSKPTKDTLEGILERAAGILDFVRTAAKNHPLHSVAKATRPLAQTPQSKFQSEDAGSRKNLSDERLTLPGLMKQILMFEKPPPVRVCPHCHSREEIVCARSPQELGRGVVVGSSNDVSKRVLLHNTLFCPVCKRQREEYLDN